MKFDQMNERETQVRESLVSQKKPDRRVEEIDKCSLHIFPRTHKERDNIQRSNSPAVIFIEPEMTSADN